MVWNNVRMSPIPAALAVAGNRETAITAITSSRLPLPNVEKLNNSEIRFFISPLLWLLLPKLLLAAGLLPPGPPEIRVLVRDRPGFWARSFAAAATRSDKRAPAGRWS